MFTCEVFSVLNINRVYTVPPLRLTLYLAMLEESPPKKMIQDPSLCLDLLQNVHGFSLSHVPSFHTIFMGIV